MNRINYLGRPTVTRFEFIEAEALQKVLLLCTDDGERNLNLIFRSDLKVADVSYDSGQLYITRLRDTTIPKAGKRREH